MEVAATRGIGDAKRLVAAFLAAELPPYLATLRPLWGLNAETTEADGADLPDPVAYDHNEPQALDRYPRLSVVGVGVPRRRRLEHREAGEIAYDVTYRLRVFVWVRATGWDRTIDIRDDLTAAVGTLLLDRQTLDLDGVLVLEDTLADEYSDVQPVRGDRFVAGAYVAFDLQRVEALRRSGRGTVATTEVTTDVLPHPALT